MRLRACSRLRRSKAAPASACLIGACLLVLPGCGGGATRFSGAGEPAAGRGGALGFAISARPESLDPLRARSLSAQLVVAQLYEPLVAQLDAPYTGQRDTRGLSLGWSSSSDRRVWSLNLRSRVSFQDGTPLNAEAVLANISRWRLAPELAGLLPGLSAADAPRPDLVRLIFAAPVRNLPQRLSDPRLGIVAPEAIRSSDPAGELIRTTNAGSGPFSLSDVSASTIELRRFRGWWGTRVGLGPALSGIVFYVIPGAASRLAELRSGGVTAASDLGAERARAIVGDPIISAVGTASPHATGIERSVRGIDGWRPAPFSGVWLTRLG